MQCWLDLLGKPFKQDARGPEAYDCLGLVLAVLHRLGTPVPDWNSSEHILALALEQWQPVTTPQAGDLILLRSTHPRWHVGLMIDADQMIHAHDYAGVVIERISCFPWQNRVEGFYRWKQ